MRDLALDLATRLGFAFGVDGVVESHGSFRLPSTGPDIGSFLLAYRGWFLHALAVWQPDCITFEMPILPETTQIVTLRKLYGLCGLTEMLAIPDRIEVREANLTDIRKHFIGVARAPTHIEKDRRRQWIKQRTIAECRERGFEPEDDNAADALAMFSLVNHLRDDKFRLQARKEAA